MLATTDGRTFTKVAALPVPVRYPAVAALGGKVFVFGGQTITGPHAGAPVEVIQAVDPSRRTAAVIGHLPEPLAGAAAATVGGELFVAGGESSAAQPQTPGAWTTQLGPREKSAGAAGGLPRHGPAPCQRSGPSTPRRGGCCPPGICRCRCRMPRSRWPVALPGSSVVSPMVHWLPRSRCCARTGRSGPPARPGQVRRISGAGPDRRPWQQPAPAPGTRLMHVVWKYPSAGCSAGPVALRLPRRRVLHPATARPSSPTRNRNDTIVKIAYPSGKIIWSYGHPSPPGHRTGIPARTRRRLPAQTTARSRWPTSVNCRVLVINPQRTVAAPDRHQRRVRPPPAGHPRLAKRCHARWPDGNLLISEDQRVMGQRAPPAVGRAGVDGPTCRSATPPTRSKLALTAISSPTTPRPGRSWEFNRRRPHPLRLPPGPGPGLLDHPSLAELLPSGVFMVNDDFKQPMVAIDPATGVAGVAVRRHRQARHRGPAGSTPRTASTCCCRTDRHQRTARPDEEAARHGHNQLLFRAVHPGAAPVTPGDPTARAVLDYLGESGLGFEFP